MKNEIELRKKIAQLLILGFKGSSLRPSDPIIEALQKQELGGVVLFDYDFATNQFVNNIQNPTQLRSLIQALNTYSTSSLPLFISIDYEGGKVNRLKESYGFCKTVSAANISQLPHDEVVRLVKNMAETLIDAGINMNFAPVLDVNVFSDNPVIGKLERSFSADPQVVIDCAKIFAQIYHQYGIIHAYKHFPGHGNSTNDTHVGFVDVTTTWCEDELLPYKALLSEPNPHSIVMMAHLVNRNLDPKGLPASLSKAMIIDLLRNKLAFQGVVVTDDLQMKAITNNYGLDQAVRLAINAGADILLFGNQLTPTPVRAEQLVDMIYQDVMTNTIPKARIEESYQRIVALKDNVPR